MLHREIVEGAQIVAKFTKTKGINRKLYCWQHFWVIEPLHSIGQSDAQIKTKQKAPVISTLVFNIYFKHL